MKRARLAAVLAVAVGVVTASAPAVAAPAVAAAPRTAPDAAVPQDDPPQPYRVQPGPLDLAGELHGAAFEIRVPATWNGTLVVYAHGYRDAADHHGEADNRSADAFVDDAAEQVMLAAGYALAGSAYASNGWAVQDAIQDTKALVDHFRAVVAQPRTTLLTGFSMGSVVALESMEHFGGVYDGAMPSCAVAAGAPRTFDGTLDIAAAYDAVFGWPAAWGTPWDVRDDLDFESEVLPVLAGQLAAPGGFGRFEFIRLLAGVPRGPEWPFTIWYFVTEARAELERRAGGPPVQNLDHEYTLSAEDRARLAALGVSGAQVDAYLAELTASRVGVSDRAARQYLDKYADYTGKIKSPVLILDTTVDALVPAAHVSAYRATVEQAGRSDLLATAWTTGNGHCNFTPQQLVTAVRALERWVRTGNRPGAFPAGQGFVDFTPPAWPQS